MARPNRTATDDLHWCAFRMVADLRKHALRNPGRRAALRTAVGYKPGHPRTLSAYRDVTRFLPEWAGPETERAFLAVAALMAAQPAKGRHDDLAPKRHRSGERAESEEQADDSENEPDDIPTDDEGASDGDGSASAEERIGALGWSCATAVARGVTPDRAMESRLHALCRGNSTTVHHQLPGLVRLLRSRQVPVNWVALVVDLAWWDRSRRRITAKWMREYYRGFPAPRSNDTDEHDEHNEETA